MRDISLTPALYDSYFALTDKEYRHESDLTPEERHECGDYMFNMVFGDVDIVLRCDMGGTKWTEHFVNSLDANSRASELIKMGKESGIDTTVNIESKRFGNSSSYVKFR